MIDNCEIFFEIVEFINKAKINKFSDLVKITIENNYDEWMIFIIDNPVVITKYIESRTF